MSQYDDSTYVYNYQKYKANFIFTEKGQVKLLNIRDKAFALIEITGAVMSGKLFMLGDVWESMACIDRLVELGDLIEITSNDWMGQERVFIKGKK